MLTIESFSLLATGMSLLVAVARRENESVSWTVSASACCDTQCFLHGVVRRSPFQGSKCPAAFVKSSRPISLEHVPLCKADMLLYYAPCPWFHLHVRLGRVGVRAQSHQGDIRGWYVLCCLHFCVDNDDLWVDLRHLHIAAVSR